MTKLIYLFVTVRVPDTVTIADAIEEVSWRLNKIEPNTLARADLQARTIRRGAAREIGRGDKDEVTSHYRRQRVRELNRPAISDDDAIRCFKEGESAFIFGLALTDNPYRATPQGVAWRRGFNHAKGEN